MARNLEQVLAKLPRKRREQVERRAAELATLKDLRQAVKRTQEELASSLGVGQDTISRLEQRGDMLISTLKRYVQAMGGELDLIARFPDRPPVVIDRIAESVPRRRAALRKPTRRRKTASVAMET
jgi:transcriptional regulator with XRE-family HTH domain